MTRQAHAMVRRAPFAATGTATCVLAAVLVAGGLPASQARAQPAMLQPSSPMPSAASVLFTAGDARVHRTTGSVPLVRGAQIGWGETIVTGADGRLQMRLDDGAMVSLQPGSRFEFTSARLPQQPLRVLFGAGTLRWAGKAVSPDEPGTELHTPRTVVQIRGATFSAAYNTDGSVSIATERDPLQICNRAGCITLVDDGAVRVRSDDVVPTQTNARATFR